MKYIRTNSRIYKIKDHEHNGFELVWRCEVKNKPSMYYEIKEHEVIHYGDTIEELCDEFIGILDSGNGSHIWYDDEYLGITEWETPEELSVLKFKYAKANLSLNEILYGAIWTDKGLIYVAKMNDKGELELL